MKFECFWSKRAFYLPHRKDLIEERGLEFFTDDNGYSEKDIEEISKLNVGKTWESLDYGSAHTVQRIK